MANQQNRKPGRPPLHGRTMTRTTMVRMFDDDYQAFEEEAQRLASATGGRVSVGAYLRAAGLAMRGKKLTL